MSPSCSKYIPEIIKECDAMLHLLTTEENAVISDEKKANIIMQINSTKEYLTLIWEKQCYGQ